MEQFDWSEARMTDNSWDDWQDQLTEHQAAYNSYEQGEVPEQEHDNSYALRHRSQELGPHGWQQHLRLHATVTTETQPGYDGTTSWFAYEEAIDDWCDVTELDPEKQGPALKTV